MPIFFVPYLVDKWNAVMKPMLNREPWGVFNGFFLSTKYGTECSLQYAQLAILFIKLSYILKFGTCQVFLDYISNWS